MQVSASLSDDSTSSPLENDTDGPPLEGDEDAPLGMDFDDFLPDLIEGLEADAEPEAFSKTLVVDRRTYLKSSIVALLSSNRSKKVTMCTL